MRMALRKSLVRKRDESGKIQRDHRLFDSLSMYGFLYKTCRVNMPYNKARTIIGLTQRSAVKWPLQVTALSHKARKH
jgi:hypothetical protein